MLGAQRSDWADRKCPLVLGIIVFLTSFWLLVWPPLSTTAYSAEKKGEDSMEAGDARRNEPCLQKVLQVVM
jgi:type II secretory pathway component PulM